VPCSPALALAALLVLGSVAGCSLLPLDLREPDRGVPGAPDTGSGGGTGGDTGGGSGSGSGSGSVSLGEPTGTGTIASITDGDTVRLRIGGDELRVRLIGLDTPEVRDPLECFGPEASAALEALAPVGSEVGYAYDRDPQDRYERELMYLYAADGTLINLELVAQGYAEAIRVEPNDRYWPELQAAERAARDAGRGLWGSCPAP